MSEQLTVFGYEFEAKLIYCLVNDTPFITQVGDVLKSDYFNNPSAKWLVDICITYYKKYLSAPTLMVFKIEIEKLDESQDLLRTEALRYLRDACSFSESSDLTFVKENTVNFCKNQEIKNAILESVDLLRISDYDSIKGRLDKALKVGLDRGIGYNYVDDFEKRYSEDSRSPIATQWDVINDLMQGGLSKGELGIVVAPPGAGKTWALINIGAAALKAGKSVVHYTMELVDTYTALRYDSVLTGIVGPNLPLHKDKIKKVVENLKGNLTIVEYPTKGASLMTVRAHLDRCISLGKRPDLIVVDYADLLKGEGKELRIELRGIYEGLRNISGEYKAPLWTASQSTRSSMEDEIIDGTKIAEDISKLSTGDFTMSLSRKTEDKLSSTGRFHIIKNRFGPDGITFPSKFNAANGDIEIYAPTTKEAVDARKDMNEGNDMLRRQLGVKFFDLME